MSSVEFAERPRDNPNWARPSFKTYVKTIRPVGFAMAAEFEEEHGFHMSELEVWKMLAYETDCALNRILDTFDGPTQQYMGRLATFEASACRNGYVFEKAGVWPSPEGRRYESPEAAQAEAMKVLEQFKKDGKFTVAQPRADGRKFDGYL